MMQLLWWRSLTWPWKEKRCGCSVRRLGSCGVIRAYKIAFHSFHILLHVDRATSRGEEVVVHLRKRLFALRKPSFGSKASGSGIVSSMETITLTANNSSPRDLSAHYLASAWPKHAEQSHW